MLIPRVSITESTAESVAGKNNEKPGTAHSAKPKPVKALRTEARRIIVHNAIKILKEVAIIIFTYAIYAMRIQRVKKSIPILFQRKYGPKL